MQFVVMTQAENGASGGFESAQDQVRIELNFSSLRLILPPFYLVHELYPNCITLTGCNSSNAVI